MKTIKDKNNIANLTSTELQELKKGFTNAEVNFLQYPIGSLDKQFKGHVIVFKDRIPVGERLIDIEWEVTGNSKYGLPGPSAVELDNVITKLIQDPSRRINGLTPKWIKTTYYELAKEMGTDTSGRTYDRIKRDLLKLTTCSIISRGAYKHKNKPSPYEVGIVSKYQQLVLKGQPVESWMPEQEKGGDGLAHHVYILLSDMYWTNLNEYYTKPINYTFMMSLGNVSLERIYQLLSLGFQTRMKEDSNGSACLNYNYLEFCGRLPVKAPISAFEAKGRLKKWLLKIQAVGYIERFDFEFNGNIDRWFIRFYPGPRATEELELIRGQRMLFEALDSNGKVFKKVKLKPKSITGSISDLLDFQINSNRNEAELMTAYSSFHEIDKSAINERSKEIIMVKYKNIGGELTRQNALLDAIEEYISSRKS